MPYHVAIKCDAGRDGKALIIAETWGQLEAAIRHLMTSMPNHQITIDPVVHNQIGATDAQL